MHVRHAFRVHDVSDSFWKPLSWVSLNLPWFAARLILIALGVDSRFFSAVVLFNNTSRFPRVFGDPWREWGVTPRISSWLEHLRTCSGSFLSLAHNSLPPVVPLYHFFGWEGSPTEIGCLKKGTPILTSLLEDLVVLAVFSMSIFPGILLRKEGGINSPRIL